MPDGGSGAGTKLALRKLTFREILAELAKVDFSSIVRYLQREDKNHWTESRSLSELENFKAFLALRSVAKFPIVPTKDIDEVWHACILHTEFYVDMCDSLFGKYVHHQPSDGKPETRQTSRINFDKTAGLFSKLTGRAYGTKSKKAYCDCSPDCCDTLECEAVVAQASDCKCDNDCRCGPL